MSNSDGYVRIEREFEASIETVWKMWVDPELFKQWYGPKGFSVPIVEMNVVVGGVRKICMEMKTPERTMSMWFTGVYKEVVAPSRLVYTESICDADGTIIPAEKMGMPEGHPDITEVIVDLSRRDGKTVMIMAHRGIPAGSPGEGGWNQAFDKLGTLLGTQ